MKNNFKFFTQEQQLQDRSFMSGPIELTIKRTNGQLEFDYWEKEEMTEEQARYLVHLLRKYDMLIRDENGFITTYHIISNVELDGEQVIDIYPTDNDGDLVYDRDGNSLTKTITLTTFLQLV
jgi:hypothetical protein